MNAPKEEWPFDISENDQNPKKEIGFYDQVIPPELMYKYTTPFEIKTSIHQCFACDMNKFTKPIELSNFNASTMVVSQSPDGIDFSTKEGKLLADILAWAQFDLNDIYFTSLVKCKESTQPEKCQSHLVSEIICVQPKIILSLGYDVGHFFDETINCAGYSSSVFHQYPMITTYHLPHVMGDQQLFSEFCNHIIQAKQQMDMKSS